MDAVIELLEHVKNTRGLSPLLKRIELFHVANDAVLDLIVQELYYARRKGLTAVSVKSLWEYGRWELRKKMPTGEPFAMNDAFQSYYARFIAILHPDLNGFFEMREPNKPGRKNLGPDAELGTKLESVKSVEENYARLLLWADGTRIEDGWRPTTPHEPNPEFRRGHSPRRPQESVGLETVKKSSAQ